MQALADAGLYRMFLPRSLGGGEVDPLTYFEVVEELTRADSAVGWSVLISTSTMTSTVRALGDRCSAAVHVASAHDHGRLGARARPRRSRARRLSPHRALEPGEQCPDRRLVPRGLPSLGWRPPAAGPRGRPRLSAVHADPADAEVIDTWSTTGMRGTGSHDYAVTDLFIPEGAGPRPRRRLPSPAAALPVRGLDPHRPRSPRPCHRARRRRGAHRSRRRQEGHVDGR